MINITAEWRFANYETGKYAVKRIDLKICEANDFSSPKKKERFNKLKNVFKGFSFQFKPICLDSS